MNLFSVICRKKDKTTTKFDPEPKDDAMKRQTAERKTGNWARVWISETKFQVINETEEK